MIERETLSTFIPTTLNHRDSENPKIKLCSELGYVVTRISDVLPKEKIWELFSSNVEATRGKIKFPYCRVDSAMMKSNSWAELAENPLYQQYFEENYKEACKAAMAAIVWVEIGFRGIENLAISLASVNWTTRIGHLVSSEERAQKIMSEGKEWYDEFKKKFSIFRNKYKIADDCFTLYKIEHLLPSIQSE